VAAEESDPQASSGGLLQSLRNLAATLVGVLQTRLELLVTEVEEERVRLGRLLALAAVAIFFLSLSVLTLTLFVIVLFWDTYRLPVIGGLAVVYLVIGGTAAFAARRQVSAKPRLFSASLAELIKDRERLTPK
jgi:uncharacterized membrane protein YqjE